MGETITVELSLNMVRRWLRGGDEPALARIIGDAVEKHDKEDRLRRADQEQVSGR